MDFAEAMRLAARDAGGKGIGTMREKTLHLVLKYYFAPDPETHEKKIGGFVADALTAEGVYEIQTRGLYRLKPKLDAFLENHPVTVVYPIAANTQLCRVDENGELLSVRKSPKHETLYSAMEEIYGLRDYFTRENFHLRVVSLDVNCYVLAGAKKRERRLDREPTALLHVRTLDSPADFRETLPELPAECSAKELSKQLHIHLDTARRYLNLLNKFGLAEAVRTENRARIWKIVP